MRDSMRHKGGATPANSNTRVSTGLVPRGRTRTAPAGVPQPLNSNTRMSLGLGRPLASPAAPAGTLAAGNPALAGNLAVVEARLRERMVQMLHAEGLTDIPVLEAMLHTPRHLFVDEALASRAYENAALPIGYGQTISQPYIVAHMISIARNGRSLGRVLEVGTGCGYQAAVLASVAREVYSIERIRALHEQAAARLRELHLSQVRLVLGDGTRGLPGLAPFDAIIVAAAGLQIPTALQEQLAIGGRLIAPEGGEQQRLVVIERQSNSRYIRLELDPVRFVPLQTGVQL